MLHVSPVSKAVKVLIAPARYSDGPTLYIIHQIDSEGHCEIHEQHPDGAEIVWPEPPQIGERLAEAAIYQFAKMRQTWKSTAG